MSKQMSQLGFLGRVISAHGWRYVFLIICIYGINQGAGEGLTFFAEQYWLTNPSLAKLKAENGTITKSSIGLGLSPSRYAEVDAFTNIPWQVKSLYGVASDVIPIWGLNRTPYMIISSLTGVLSFLFLWTNPFALTVVGSAILLFFANFSIASPDVMIDASIAEKSSKDTSYAADLQALCWISFGVFKILSLIFVPMLFEAYGARGVFGITTLTSLAVIVPSSLGWLGEQRKERDVLHPADSESIYTRFRTFADHPQSGPLVRLSFLLTFVSLLMGFVSMKVENNHAFISGFAMLFITPLVCILVYYYESKIDVGLAKFSIYIFLSGAIQPSTPVLFYWMKADNVNCDMNLPCFSPDFIANLSIMGYVMFVFGTMVYNKYLTKWSYKKIYMTTQIAMFVLNIIDLFWVTRMNIKIGISDQAFVLGDEVISPMISRWNTMPMLILAAVLCPPNVEATFFAMTMGLSNFGGSLGDYFGVGLMTVFNLNDPHQYEKLPEFVICRSIFRLLPLCLIPFFLPDGSPEEPPARNWVTAEQIPITDLELTSLKHDEGDVF